MGSFLAVGTQYTRTRANSDSNVWILDLKARDTRSTHFRVHRTQSSIHIYQLEQTISTHLNINVNRHNLETGEPAWLTTLSKLLVEP